MFIHVTDRRSFSPVTAGIALVSAIHTLYPSNFAFRDKGFDRLAGTPVVRTMILQHRPVAEIAAWWRSQADAFSKLRQQYFLYN